MASCKSCETEPWTWLKAASTELPCGASPESLLPDTWLQANPSHKWTIAQRRREERQKKNYLQFAVRIQTFDAPRSGPCWKHNTRWYPLDSRKINPGQRQ